MRNVSSKWLILIGALLTVMTSWVVLILVKQQADDITANNDYIRQLHGRRNQTPPVTPQPPVNLELLQLRGEVTRLKRENNELKAKVLQVKPKDVMNKPALTVPTRIETQTPEMVINSMIYAVNCGDKEAIKKLLIWNDKGVKQRNWENISERQARFLQWFFDQVEDMNILEVSEGETTATIHAVATFKQDALLKQPEKVVIGHLARIGDEWRLINDVHDQRIDLPFVPVAPDEAPSDSRLLQILSSIP